MPDTQHSEAVQRTYRLLEIFQKTIIKRLFKTDNPDEVEKRAISINKRLITIANLESGEKKCPDGKVRNTETGECEVPT